MALNSKLKFCRNRLVCLEPSIVLEIENKDKGLSISFDSSDNFGYFVVKAKTADEPVSAYESNPLVDTFPRDAGLGNDPATGGSGRKRKRAISGFAKSIKKNLKLTFNDTLPDCTMSSLP